MNPKKECVWKIIMERGGDLEALQTLSNIQKENLEPHATGQGASKPPLLLKGIAAKVMARSGRLSWIVHSIRR